MIQTSLKPSYYCSPTFTARIRVDLPRHGPGPYSASLNLACLRKITGYYRAIDRRDFKAVKNTFTQFARYQRQDWEVFDGLGEIMTFFKEKRKIHGVHHINSMKLSHQNPFSVQELPFKRKRPVPMIIVEGSFENFDKAVLPDPITFVDYWAFNHKRPKAMYRRSLISTSNV